jgi:hypothetical protein
MESVELKFSVGIGLGRGRHAAAKGRQRYFDALRGRVARGENYAAGDGAAPGAVKPLRLSADNERENEDCCEKPSNRGPRVHDVAPCAAKTLAELALMVRAAGC